MDAFSIIQHFFTRMNCQFCNHAFVQGDIELIRKEEGAYIVNVFCHQCDTQNGVAMVGVETNGLDPKDIDPETLEAFLEEVGEVGDLDMLLGGPKAMAAAVRQQYQLTDPELTDSEVERLSEFDPISSDDVIEAHRFFGSLDGNWMRFIPEEMRQSQTVPHTESPVD